MRGANTAPSGAERPRCVRLRARQAKNAPDAVFGAARARSQRGVVQEVWLRRYTGNHIDILYEVSGQRAVIHAVFPRAASLLRAGARHLVADVEALLGALRAKGVRSFHAVPDRSATRLTLEEAGFRGTDLMRYAPETPAPAPVLDAGRPGAFGAATRVLLESGEEVAAGVLHPGLRVAEGGRIKDVLVAVARRVCRLDGAVYGALNRVRTGSGSVSVADLPGATLEETSGTDLVWLVSEHSRIRSGAHLFEDMWGSAALRQNRRISETEVIAALNAPDEP